MRHAWRCAGLRTLLILSIVGCAAGHAAAQGRRVVDLVTVGNAASERGHLCDGAGTTLEEARGERWRGVTGWFACNLRVLDDTPLTLVVAVIGTDGGRRLFDVLVDDRKVVTRTVESRGTGRVEIGIDVPEAFTAGRTDVTVRFQAVGGNPTPGLLEMRSVQEHLEARAVPRSRDAGRGSPRGERP